MKILAIGAHADDIELACGGSLLKWTREGHQITIYIATDSAYSTPDGTPVRSSEAAAREAAASAKRIGAKLIIDSFKCFKISFSEPLNARLVSLITEERPELVITHWDGDTHPDHQAVSKATLHSSRHIPSVLMYMSNWYLSTCQFDGRFFVDISETLDAKLDLIGLFHSENDRTSGEWVQYARHKAAVLGKQLGILYAEAFYAVKYLI